MTSEQEQRCFDSFMKSNPSERGYKQGYAAAIEREVAPVAAERDRYREALEEAHRSLTLGFKEGDQAEAYMHNRHAHSVVCDALKAGKEGEGYE